MRTIPIVTNFMRATPRKRLWISGSALAVFLLTLIVGNHFIAADKSVTREMLGHDFLAFYTAGSLVRQGRAHDLYNLNAVRDFEQSTAHAAGLEVGKSFGPWWNPPFYALIFEPLTALPYAKALDTWRWISLACVVIAIGLLSHLVASASLSTRWQHWMLVPLLMVISMPFLQAASHGQNTFTSLLLLTVTVILWRQNRKFTAGIIGGFLFYKPQLGAVVALAMAADLGWTTLAGLSVTGIFLLLVNLIALPGTLTDWMHELPANVHWIQVENAYLWERHVTLKSFWRLLLQGREAGESTLLTTAITWMSLAAIGGSLAYAFIRGWNNRLGTDPTIRRDRLISATIIAMPLLMPFYFDYDLLLLAIPATLYAAERITYPDRINPNDRYLTASWVTLFAWLYVNAPLALHSHVGGTVLLLTTVSVLSTRRINQLDGEAGEVIVLHPQRIALAA
jgi:hypothetical protein